MTLTNEQLKDDYGIHIKIEHTAHETFIVYRTVKCINNLSKNSFFAHW